MNETGTDTVLDKMNQKMNEIIKIIIPPFTKRSYTSPQSYANELRNKIINRKMITTILIALKKTETFF